MIIGYIGLENTMCHLSSFQHSGPFKRFLVFSFVSEEAKNYLLNYEDLATGLFGGGSLDSLMERTERLYFTGTDYTINLIPIALVSVAVLGCEYKCHLLLAFKESF
jgi:hypothetical protein